MRGCLSERKVVAIKVENVKVPHAVIVILRRLDHLGSARGQFGVYTIDIVHEYTDASISRYPLGLLRRK